MKERSWMPYDVVAYEADDDAMILSPAEEGIFHRMMRRAWMNGSIPSDIEKLAQICRVRPSTMKAAWLAIGKMWTQMPGNPTRLVSEKQESERVFLQSKRDSARVAGKLSAKARAIKNNKSTNAERPLNSPSISPSPVPVPVLGKENTEEGKGIAAAEKQPTARRVDAAYEMFREAYDRERSPDKYQGETKDFVQLAKLRKKLGINGQTPEGWDKAIANYFQSATDATLADLCCRYGVFVKWPLDRFGKPIGGNGNGKEPESREQAKVRRNIEAAGVPNPFLHLGVGDCVGSGSVERAGDFIPATARRVD